MLKIFVTGDPAPQGSKRHVGGGVLVESCKRLPDWRKDVRAACLDGDGQPKARFDGAVCLHLDFILRRPKSLPKTGRHHRQRKSRTREAGAGDR